MGSSVKYNLNEFSEAIAKKLKIKDKIIRVGFFDDKYHPINESTRSFLGASNFDRVSMGDLANILNNGFINRISKSYVPPRPFMDEAREEVKENIGNILKEASKTESPIDYIVESVSNTIKEKLLSGKYEPNTASTLAHKNSSIPLVDESHLLNGIESRIENV